MSVRKREDRPKKPWLAVVDLGLDRRGRRRRSEQSFPLRSEAVEWEREQIAQRRALRRRPSTPQLLGVLLTQWIDHGEHVLGWSPRHVENCRRLIAGPLAELATFHVHDLEPDDLDAWLVDQLRAGVSRHSLRQARNIVRAAYRRSRIYPNPAADVEVPTPRRKRPAVLSGQRDPAGSDVERFLEAIAGDRLAPYWIVSLTLALRPSEALGLRWEDVEGSRVTIARTVQYSGGAYHLRDRTKTDEPRTLPLPDVTREAFERQNLIQLWERSEALTWQEHPFGRLVFTNRTGGPLHAPYARRRLQTVLARAGLPRLTLYQLRHTGATLLLRLGAPLEQVREIMGHSRVEMTLGYVDAAEDLQRDALGRLDAFLREG